MFWFRRLLMLGLAACSLGVGSSGMAAEPSVVKTSTTAVILGEEVENARSRTSSAGASTAGFEGKASTMADEEGVPIPLNLLGSDMSPVPSSTRSSTEVRLGTEAVVSGKEDDLVLPSNDATEHSTIVERLQRALDGLAARIELVSDKVSVLRETALGNSVGNTRVIIRHRNELGDDFLLEEVNYLLDGRLLLQETDKADNLASVQSRVVFDGHLDPGTHELSAEVVCRSGGFGVFSYVKAYRYKVSSKYAFRVREGRTNRIDIVVVQKSDITLSANERLSVRYDFTSEKSSLP